MKILIGLFLFINSHTSFSGLRPGPTSNTDLGVLNSVRNGVGTIKECEEPDKAQCRAQTKAMETLGNILSYTTTNQCIASASEMQSLGIDVPKCPNGNEDVKVLPNTYPNGGVFALYNGSNSGFIFDLVKGHLDSPSATKVNVVVPLENVEKLAKNVKLTKLLNNGRVNIVPVPTTPKVGKWMQDSFQFTSVNGEPAIVQLEHREEKKDKIEYRFACQLAAACNIPYYLPEDYLNYEEENQDSGFFTADLDSGGNVEALPDGTILMGTIQSRRYDHKLPRNRARPYMTENQKALKRTFEQNGQNVLEIDISFLEVGHVDEIINIIKTNKPAPCDFAVMMANPKKAFEIIDNASGEGNSFQCEKLSYQKLLDKGSKGPVSKIDLAILEQNNCINNMTLKDFKESKMYSNMRGENFDDVWRPSPSKVMETNKEKVVNHLKGTTGCESPPVIDIPVMYRDDRSYTPNLVNGVVNTPLKGPSKAILPKSYFKPFDDYVKSELEKYGVKTNFVHDIGYHLGRGDVHCGTNTARICTP